MLMFESIVGAIFSGLTAVAPVIGGLGIFGALLTAIFTSVRERKTRIALRRRHLAEQFLKLVSAELHLRRHPSPGQASEVAGLLMVAALLKGELHPRRGKQGAEWIDAVVHRVRFAQPAPQVEVLLIDITPALVSWMQSPRRAWKPSPIKTT